MSMVPWRVLLVPLAIAGLTAGCGGGDDAPAGDGGSASSAGAGDGHDHGGESGGESGGDSGGEHGGGHEGEDSPPAFGAGQETTAVDVSLQDYAFVGVPDTVQGPNVLFRGSIKGGNTHEMYVVNAGGDRVGEVHGFKAPAVKELAVVLEPGTYTLECHIDEGAKTHLELGMKKSFTVTG